MTEISPTKITDFPLNERVQRFEQVVKANVEKVGPLGGLLLSRMGKVMVDLETCTNEEQRNSINREKLVPILDTMAEEVKKDASLMEAINAVLFWRHSLFPLG